jgi:hypothetical protein
MAIKRRFIVIILSIFCNACEQLRVAQYRVNLFYVFSFAEHYQNSMPVDLNAIVVPVDGCTKMLSPGGTRCPINSNGESFPDPATLVSGIISFASIAVAPINTRYVSVVLPALLLAVNAVIRVPPPFDGDV